MEIIFENNEEERIADLLYVLLEEFHINNAVEIENLYQMVLKIIQEIKEEEVFELNCEEIEAAFEQSFQEYKIRYEKFGGIKNSEDAKKLKSKFKKISKALEKMFR